MAFHYRLEAVLRLQRSIENQEEHRLLACVVRVTALRNQIAEWERERSNRQRMAAAEMQAGTTGVALSVLADWDRGAKRRQAEILPQFEQAEHARRAQVARLQQARQKREVLESLKERLETAYDLEELRRVQQVLDDMFLTRAFYYKAR